jgi:hypothetical protein
MTEICGVCDINELKENQIVCDDCHRLTQAGNILDELVEWHLKYKGETVSPDTAMNILAGYSTGITLILRKWNKDV